MTYNVFIDRPVDPSPEGRSRLAAALARRFNLPEDQLRGHLAAGRLRVKANADEQTARALIAELQSLGAVASMEPIPPPPARPATPYESGLSAAFRSTGGQEVDLGALGQVDPAGAAAPALKLGSLDGLDEAPPPPPLLLEEDPPPPPKPARVDPAPAKPLDVGARPLPSAVGRKDDPFAPPDAEDLPLELAESPAKPTTSPSRTVAGGSPSPVLPPPATPRVAVSQPARPAAVQPAASPPPVRPAPPGIVDGGPLARTFAGRPRHRLLAGLALALFVGFGAAHVYATSAEGRYADLRRSGEAETAPATEEEYQEQLERRAEAVEALSSAHTRVTIAAGVIWILVGAAVGFVFFRFLA